MKQMTQQNMINAFGGESMASKLDTIRFERLAMGSSMHLWMSWIIGM